MAEAEDMPDFDMPDAGAAVVAAAASSDDGLDEGDELELALENALEDEGQQQEEQQQQQQQAGDEPPREQRGAAPPTSATLQADAVRAATVATEALQQEEEGPLPLTEDGFIDLGSLTAKQHQRYNALVNEMLSEQQLDRYAAFRRSNLRKPIQLLMSRTLGGPVANQSKALTALSSVAKSFVDDLIATAIKVAEERGEGTPLQPAHIHEAYQRLIAEDKVPGKAPRRRAFL